MRTRSLRLLLGALWLLHACATLPTGPHVLVLPQAGTPLEEFQRDDKECRSYASHQLPTGAQAGARSAATLQWRYDMAYVQCMYAKGYRVPDGAVPPPPPQTVRPPPPPGPPRS
jgi:outer membrane biogenesis lipoprotein LolB